MSHTPAGIHVRPVPELFKKILDLRVFHEIACVFRAVINIELFAGTDVFYGDDKDIGVFTYLLELDVPKLSRCVVDPCEHVPVPAVNPRISPRVPRGAIEEPHNIMPLIAPAKILMLRPCDIMAAIMSQYRSVRYGYRCEYTFSRIGDVRRAYLQGILIILTA